MKNRCPLTLRQQQVMQLLAWGEDFDGIAEALELSPNTVREHYRRAVRRLDLRHAGRLVVVLTCVHAGWVTLGPDTPVRNLERRAA